MVVPLFLLIFSATCCTVVAGLFFTVVVLGDSPMFLTVVMLGAPLFLTVVLPTVVTSLNLPGGGGGDSVTGPLVVDDLDVVVVTFLAIFMFLILSLLGRADTSCSALLFSSSFVLRA